MVRRRLRIRALLRRGPEICRPQLDHCSFRLLWLLLLFFRICLLLRRSLLRNGRWRRLLSPDTIHATAVSRQSAVIAEEQTSGLERFIGPGIIAECAPAIGRARQYHDLFAVPRIPAPVIEDHVDRPIDR